jgi:hypothetical protein
MSVYPISVRSQEQIGSVVSGAGIIWATQVWTSSRWGMLGLLLTRGPIEVCTLGILIWVTAKWRAIRQRRSNRLLVA